MAKKILIVDDNEMAREVFVEQLRVLGYETMTAENGQNALSCFEQQHFDLVLTDCQMPIMNGYELAKTIRARKQSIPILAISGSDTKAERNECQAAGINGYLEKPVTLEQLKQAMNQWLDNS